MSDVIEIQNKEIWSADDFCKVMGWSRKTIINRISAGDPMPPSIRVGNKRYFRRDIVMQWLADMEACTDVAA